MHKLLKRIIRKKFAKVIEHNECTPFIESINQAFEQNDLDRRLLERSLMLTSAELNDINHQLKGQLDENKVYQQQLEETLVEQNTIINSVPEAIIHFKSDGRLKQINNAGRKFLDIAAKDIINLTIKQCLKLILKKLNTPEKFISILKKIQKDNTLEINDHISTKNGEYYECYSVSGFFSGQYIGRVWCFKNITNIRLNQEQLHYQAFHDDLTKLPNRALLIEAIDHAISLAAESQKKIYILFLDLDDFKKINDTIGHQEGDKFLIEVSKSIKTTLRRQDILGRLGGDEFLIMLEGIDTQEQVIDVHNRILALFSQPFKLCGNKYVVSCSIGISSFPQDGNSSDILIRKADMAMYQAKKNGRNTYHYFDKGLENSALRRVFAENQIREAINKKQFIFHFQPKMNLSSNTVVGVEALIRIQKENGDIVYPDQFIPISEDIGLIRNITKSVIHEACLTLQRWQLTALKEVPIAINISAYDISSYNFIDDLLFEIKQAQLAPNLLQLEITESVLMHNTRNVIATINQLKSNNISVSIDDFGTGYSSFSYLHDLDVDYIKIDKSFVQNIDKTKKSKSIVKSIIDLGSNLGIKVIAEGIENIEEHQFLLDSNCLLGQGYYYNRPLTEKALIDFIRG